MVEGHLSNISIKFERNWPRGIGGVDIYFFSSISSSGGHFLYRSGKSLAVLVGNHLGNISMTFESHWPKGSGGVSFGRFLEFLMSHNFANLFSKLSESTFTRKQVRFSKTYRVKSIRFCCFARNSLTLLRTPVRAIFVFAPKIDCAAVVILHCILG